ncbi:hypothetical protein FQA47_024272 [Oryzias melastigma]|uniref:Uncharacterized protein n=1 Tax=Oryzias melastigma TaxID=30732 RepID=A0A834F271_ORYME|nr:hypothetical protein FQA47_024272 [Oryzias melastigma]
MLVKNDFFTSTSDSGVEEHQWWPASAVETRNDRPSTNHSVTSVFTEAFPTPPDSPGSDPCDLDAAIPTLTHLLRAKATQDLSFLDSFHDLNKMIGQRYKRGSSVSRQLLLQTLHLQDPETEIQTASWTTTRRLSPGLPSANQHAPSGRRRLSYDYNRNTAEVMHALSLYNRFRSCRNGLPKKQARLPASSSSSSSRSTHQSAKEVSRTSNWTEAAACRLSLVSFVSLAELTGLVVE